MCLYLIKNFSFIAACSLFDTAQLTVVINDYNDNPPVLEKTIYSSRKFILIKFFIKWVDNLIFCSHFCRCQYSC